MSKRPASQIHFIAVRNKDTQYWVNILHFFIGVKMEKNSDVKGDVFLIFA